LDKKHRFSVGAYQTFFSHLEKLKHLRRSGWVRDKVPNPESVAEHSFKAAVMAMVLADAVRLKVNKEKLLKMALIHDVGESIIGDIIQYTPSGVLLPKVKAKKHRDELAAIKRIFGRIENGDEYIGLFKEFDAHKTNESIIFNELDRLELVLQAAEYEKTYGMTLNTYFKTGSREIHIKEFRELLEDILESRKKQHANKQQ
jgi:putative hydrolase of HD superfamily